MDRRTVVVLGLMTLVFAGAADRVAAGPLTINVDFGPNGQSVYSGLGAAPDTGLFWNAVSIKATGSSTLLGGTNLLASDGVTPTGVSVITTASQAWTDPGSHDLLRDRIFVMTSWTRFTVTLQGLTASAYDLYAYGSNTQYASTFADGTASDYSLGSEDGSSWIHNTNYAVLTGLVPVDGVIEFTVDRYNSGSYASRAAVIGGLQLREVADTTPVPEPASVLLLGTGLLGAGRAWRKRRQ